MEIQIAQEQLVGELECLASYSDTAAPSVTRVVYTSMDMAGRAYIKSLCAERGLEIREDAAGNTFARWPGSEPSLPAVGTGSHIDAIPYAGKYDGTVGVLGGLEAIRALQRAGVRPRRSIELILFTSEEPTRFGIGCMGSRLLSGSLGSSTGMQLKDRDGLSLDQARERAGFKGALDTVRLTKDRYAAFVELHIEQGPLLENEGLAVGLVTAIAAPASLKVQIDGEGGHAGAMLMPRRHDAFLAAAELALAVEAAAKGTGAIDTVGTVGVCDVFPGAVNSVPSRARLEIDIRDIDLARRDGVLETVQAASREIETRRGVHVAMETVNADAPATCDPRIVEILGSSCEKNGLPYTRLVSRAYHDSRFMAQIAPVAMLFVRSKGGFSHRPDEYSSPEDIAAGVRVLAAALEDLAR
jgi:N-carbamoyl-L-amino-acid hydrolase